jgi:hypothetical protein
MLWLSLAISALAALVTDVGRHPANGGADADFFKYWLVFEFAVLAALVAKWALFDQPRYLWSRRWETIAPAWVKLGWAPLGLGLLILSLVAAPPWTLWLTVATASVTVLWSSFTGRSFGPDRSRWPWWARLVVRNLPLLFLWGSLSWRQPTPPTAQAGIAASALLLAYACGEESLAQAWEDHLSDRSRIAALAALIAGGVGLLVAATLQGLTPSIPVAVGATGLAVVQRLPASSAAPFALRLPFNRFPWGLLWLMFVGGGALASVLAALIAVVAVVSPWLVIIGVIINLALALRREVAPGPRPRSKVFG